MANYKLAANFIKCRKFEQSTNDNIKLLAISYILCYKYVMFCSNDVMIKLTLMIQNIITYNVFGLGEVAEHKTSIVVQTLKFR